MKVLKRYLLVFLLVFGHSVFAQSFLTKVSTKTIGKKDVLQIEYLVQDASLEQFNLPRFTTWSVVSGPNLSSSTIQTGKLVKQETSYSILVQPKSTGILTVPGATALINNKPQKSNDITIDVKNVDHVGGAQAATTPQNQMQGSLFDQFPFDDEQYDDDQFLRSGESAKDKIKNNILIKLDVSKHSAYVGEPILASYKLCTRVKSQSRVVKQPMFNGCTVVEMTSSDPVAHREVINGKSYNVYVIRRVQLYPLEEGKLVLPQTSVENKVQFYTMGKGSSYRDLYYSQPAAQEQTITLQNAPVAIDVKPLPPMPSVTSATFSGALGKFDVEASTNKTIESNNTNQLTFSVIGQGNLQQVKAPVINWPKGIEAFEPTEQDQDDKSTFPVMVRKVFTFPFVANKKGQYSIPPIEFTYFDPNANKYITKVTPPLTLNVLQGSKVSIPAFIKTNDAEGFQTRLYIILGAAVVAVVIGLVWYNGRNKLQPIVAAPKAVAPVKDEKIAAPVTSKETVETSSFIYAIKDLQPDYNSSNFYRELCSNLNKYIQTKYGIPAGEVQGFIKHRMNEDFTFDQLNTLMQNCMLGMYTPVFTIDEAMEHRLLAIEILNKLERV
jgi:hypothetical protein